MLNEWVYYIKASFGGGFMKSINVLRHEKKFYITYQEYTVLRSLLKGVLVPDPNSKANGDYFIRSVYFDSLYNENYYEKILGLKNRRKLRTRLYQFDDQQIKLEIKEKDGDYLSKKTLLISKEQYHQLLKQDYSFLDNSNLPNAEAFRLMLNSSYQRPVITIDYEREAYVHPFSNLRINFDKNIRMNQHDYDIFDQHLIMTPVSVEPIYVLEIKYDSFMPDWLRPIIESVSTTKTSYSKYCIGRYL